MPVAKHSQDAANRPRMAGEGDVCTVIVTEHIIEKHLQTRIQRRVGLARVGLPEWVVFSEASLEVIAGKLFVYPCLTTPAVASVDANGFAKQLEFLSKTVHKCKLFPSSLPLSRRGRMASELEYSSQKM